MNVRIADPEGCRARQRLLTHRLQQLDVELAVLTRPESIQWLTGAYVGPLFEPMAAIDADGLVTLVLPDRKLDVPHVTDQTLPYEAKWLSTMRSDQRQASTTALVATISPPTGRAAVEFSRVSQHLTQSWQCSWIDIEPALFELRRQKHGDEIALLRHANEANRRMYERAREIIEPGISELDVYSELQRVAVHHLGEPLTYFGQDFQAASRGGPPRQRCAEAGELYILDLGIGFRGYFSDNARTFAVSKDPSPDQLTAWRRLVEIFELIETKVRPGVSCAGIFHEVDDLLSDLRPWQFNHHLGHGVGLAPHEAPHLNPHWDDEFAEGDFFTAEPGLYHPDLNAGIRLEQNYLVTSTGVELLTPWSLEL
jgi:Xaa-Pro dipeptidase